MPGNSQLSSERRDEDEFAAALKRHDEQEIRTARHIQPSSTLTEVMVLLSIALILHPNFTLPSIKHRPRIVRQQAFAGCGD